MREKKADEEGGAWRRVTAEAVTGVLLMCNGSPHLERGHRKDGERWEEEEEEEECGCKGEMHRSPDIGSNDLVC